MSASVRSTDPLTARQLDLLRDMAKLEPQPWVFGGYAEDALLAGTATRTHLDVDWLVPRRELELRLAQARTLGFTALESWGESAPGEPFYLFAQNRDLSIDIGVTDEHDGRLLARVGKLAFEVDGLPAPAGYQFELPRDTYTHPPAQLDGIDIRVVSPLALYQIRAAIAAKDRSGRCPPSNGRAFASYVRPSFPDERSDNSHPESNHSAPRKRPSTSSLPREGASRRNRRRASGCDLVANTSNVHDMKTGDLQPVHQAN
jgi:hypothetical protein